MKKKKVTRWFDKKSYYFLKEILYTSFFESNLKFKSQTNKNTLLNNFGSLCNKQPIVTFLSDVSSCRPWQLKSCFSINTSVISIWLVYIPVFFLLLILLNFCALTFAAGLTKQSSSDESMWELSKVRLLGTKIKYFVRNFNAGI